MTGPETATISSQLRIQSIISPPDPSDLDDNTADTNSQTTPKRTFEDAFPRPILTPGPPTTDNLLDRASHPTASSEGGSELTTIPDDEEQRPVLAGNSNGKRLSRAMRPPMRSSIACLRCRKSKIKCDNDNTGAACDTCIKSGHKCEFPDSAPQPPKRAEPPTNHKQEKETGHERKRAKKLDDVTPLDSQRSTAYAEEVLSAQYLTAELWDQVFAIYKLHFATELPFLHLPTLKEKMTRQLKDQTQMTPDVNLVLLGILALTARFHADLVKYIAHMSHDRVGGPRSKGAYPRPDPAAASEFFANALATALGPLKTAMTVATVERVQALLMLGLYEWGQARDHGGLGAWMYVGVAIRLAQALKLGFGDKAPGARESSALVVPGVPSRSPSEVGITKEVRRRTMFSCLILDRMLTCGQERTSVIRSEDLEIQLPCTEMAFDLGLDTYTGFLSSPEEKRDSRVINDHSLLSCFVQLVDIWRDISKFGLSGGRHAEKEPPWHPGSNHRTLREKLDSYYAHLPETSRLSTSNYYRHDNQQATSMFVSLHMLGSVCQIVLHREFIPFIPIKFDGPEGPRDESALHGVVAPDGFWEASADNLFRAARDIVDLIDMCREKLPNSSLVLFATWVAAFVGIYARHFSHMDRQNHMVSQEEMAQAQAQGQAGAEIGITAAESSGVTFHTLNKMAQYFTMASHYLEHFRNVDKYYAKVKAEYNRNVAKRGFEHGQAGDGRLSIRPGGEGAGLEEWRGSKGDRGSNSGLLMDEDRSQPPFDGSDQSRDSTVETGSSTGLDGGSLLGSSMGDGSKLPRSTPSFTAINSRGPTPGLGLEAEGLRRDGSRYQHPGLQPPVPAHSHPSHSWPGRPSEGGPVERQPSFNINLHIDNYQLLRIGAALGDVQEFAGLESSLHPVFFDRQLGDRSQMSSVGQATGSHPTPHFAVGEA